METDSPESLFWNEAFWLPSNFTWDELQRDGFYPDINYMLLPILIGLFYLILRFVLERFLFTPLGLRCGLKVVRRKQVPTNPFLEKVYRLKQKPDSKRIQGLSKQLDMTERQVERWFRQRSLQDKPTVLAKFNESSWRFSFYFSAFIYGLIVLSNKPWFWDINQCWTDYPKQVISADIKWYYILECGFYWSLVFSLFIDTKRKDFREIAVHHFITIMLISFSWLCNFVRIGSLVLIVHDVSDAFLEGAKTVKYLNKYRLCDVMFVLFAASWYISRTGFFPFWILHNVLFKIPASIAVVPSYYLFCVLLCALMVLHLFWSYLISLAVINSFKSGGAPEKDVRSETDEPITNSEASQE